VLPDCSASASAVSARSARIWIAALDRAFWLGPFSTSRRTAR
jgi:hypothetical protein